MAAGRGHRYAGDSSSECQYDTEAGNIVVSFYPGDRSRVFGSVQASYGALQTVQTVGDAAEYSKEHGVLAIRKGDSTLLLTLATPDEQRGYAILTTLGRRVATRLH